jgi:adenosylhomocysteine nucleosidase
MKLIAILAALPSELKPLVKGWQRQPAEKYVSLWTKHDESGDELIAACAGMGANAARRAFRAAEERGPLELVVSIGLAGATSSEHHLGEVSAVSVVIDVQTGERFTLTEGKRRLSLATVTQTAGAAEKARLLASYGAVLVDMEAATVARLAAARGLPVCCFKAVSDAAETKLPEIDRFLSSEGQLSLPRFLAHVAVRPASWQGLVRLAKNSKQGSEALAVRVREFLAHKDWQYTNRTGHFARPLTGTSREGGE